jgi:hypothetical protein
MIARCANPGCFNEFRYLHQGKLYVRHSREKSSPQLLWICEACARTMLPMYMENATVVNMAPRRDAVRHQI